MGFTIKEEKIKLVIRYQDNNLPVQISTVKNVVLISQYGDKSFKDKKDLVLNISWTAQIFSFQWNEDHENVYLPKGICKADPVWGSFEYLILYPVRSR